jgi:lipid-A-disaccharide synthase
MKCYIISGEASGDLHASNLVREIKKIHPAAEFRGWGGDLMAAQGVNLVKHYRELAFMGFIEVLANLRTILRNIEFCKRDIREYNPDVIILVDYPGFNLRIAKHAAGEGRKVIYYISPQVWAWKQSRVHQIKKYVHRMLVILPFEKEFYARFGYDVDFVGHPLLDAIGDPGETRDGGWKKQHNLDSRPVIALLPGSRKQEIQTMLPLMLSVADDFPGYQFVIGGAPSVDPGFYKGITGDKQAAIVFGATYDLLRNSSAALVTSGTATLETALFRVPEVVCYKGNEISYRIARTLVKIGYISLVNLIMDREVVKELIQSDLNTRNLVFELRKLTDDNLHRKKMLADFDLLRQKLGGTGASERAARIILSEAGS